MPEDPIQKVLFDSFLISSLLLVFDLVVGLIAVFVNSSLNLFETASNMTVFEFAILLFLGSCMMSRQPLDETKRYDADGAPVKTWRMAKLGKRFLLAALLTLLFGVVLLLLGLPTGILD